MKQFVLFLLFSLAAILTAFSGLANGFTWLWTWLQATHPVLIVTVIAAVFCVTCFLSGLATGDHSWVDRVWGMLPPVFSLVYAIHAPGNIQSFILCALVLLWGMRLSFNLWQKGGFRGVEDYRWPLLRARIRNRLTWNLFSFFFVSAFRLGVLVLLTLPIYLLTIQTVSLCYLAAGSFFFLFFLLFETLADLQQAQFQALRYNVIHGRIHVLDAHPEFLTDVKNGFCSSNLFRHSRHPAYFGELGLWWSIALLPLSASHKHWWLAIIGAGLLTLLILCSTRFTEKQSQLKYRAYKAYKKRTSVIIPWLAR